MCNIRHQRCSMFVVHIVGNGRVKPPGQSNKPLYGCQVTVQVNTIMFRFKEIISFIYTVKLEHATQLLFLELIISSPSYILMQ